MVFDISFKYVYKSFFHKDELSTKKNSDGKTIAQICITSDITEIIEFCFSCKIIQSSLENVRLGISGKNSKLFI